MLTEDVIGQMIRAIHQQFGQAPWSEVTRMNSELLSDERKKHDHARVV